MSYILNALRKSEQERQTHAPTLQSSIYQEHSVEKRRGVWLIIALIVINLVTLIFFIRLSTTERIVELPGAAVQNVIPAAETKQSQLLRTHGTAQNLKNPAILPSQPAKLRQPAAKEHDFSISGVVDARYPSPSAPAINAGMTSRKSNPAGQSATASRPLHGSSRSSVDPLQLAPTAPKSGSRSKLAEPVKNNTAISPQRQQAMPPTRNTAQPVATKKASVFKERKNTVDKHIAHLQSKANTAANVKTMRHRQSAVAKTAAIKPLVPTVPLLSELPLEFRRQVPKLNINVFVYAEDPPQRFVIVDMVKYRTGMNIQKIQLKEILSDSLVVEYMGKTFRILRP